MLDNSDIRAVINEVLAPPAGFFEYLPRPTTPRKNSKIFKYEGLRSVERRKDTGTSVDPVDRENSETLYIVPPVEGQDQFHLFSTSRTVGKYGGAGDLAVGKVEIWDGVLITDTLFAWVTPYKDDEWEGAGELHVDAMPWGKPALTLGDLAQLQAMI